MGKNRKKGRAKGEFHSKQHQQNLHRAISLVNSQIVADRRIALKDSSERPIVKLGSLRGLLSVRVRDDAMERQYTRLFQPGSSISDASPKKSTKMASRENARPKRCIGGIPSLVSLCITTIVSVFDSLEADYSCVQYFQMLPPHIIESLSAVAAQKRTITDGNIACLCSPSIKHLYLSGNQISGAGLREIIPRQSLGTEAAEEQSGPESWEDEASVDLGMAFKGCCKLVQLDLQSVAAMDLPFMAELVVRLPTLRYLALRDCFNEGTGHTALLEYIPCLQRLRSLDLRDNDWLDDECLCLFASVCSSWRARLGFQSRLLILKLAGCDQVTEEGTHGILRMNFPELRKLEYIDDD
jgi:hypothetical protein